MDDIAAIRTALAEKLQTPEFVAALAAADNFQFSQVSPYLLSNPTTPCAYVMLIEQDWPDGQRIRDETFTFTVHVLIALNSDVASQAKLDPLVASTGATSVKAALEVPDEDESKVTLDGLIADLEVTRCRPDRLYPIRRGTEHLEAFGAEWTVLVYPKPDQQ